MGDSEFLEAALLYASLGWRVFPLKPRTKDKHVVPHWNTDATTDEGQIRAWWGKNPDYNIGIATGNGLCVVDVDDKPDKHPVLGSDMLRDWELEHGDISETVCAKSGTGGMHYYFNVGDARISGCQSDTIFIDLRCDGNYIVAPPSIHPDTGLPYTWDISPEDMPPARATANDKACIQWVYDNRRGADGRGNAKKVTVPKGKVHEGEGRNVFLYKQGCSARAKGSDDDMIAAWLDSLNRLKCQPPLDEAELAKVVASVCTKQAGLSEEARERVEKSGVTHVQIANRLMVERNACFLDGAPAVFDGTQYRLGWDAVERAIIELYPNTPDKKRSEVTKYMRLVMGHETASPSRYIGFANGVLDIETTELLSLTPDMRIPNVIPHDWNPDARSTLFDRTVRKIACGDPFIEHNLCEFIGLCMYRSGKYAYSAILLGRQGDTASNGKSTYIDILRNVLGEDNYSALDLNELGQRFQQEHLAGKLANLGDDISSEFAKGANLTVFKKAVAGTEITTDVKGRKGYKFTPYCTMIFSANKFPKLETADDGVMRRLFPIRFNAKFTPQDPDFDPDIGEKLKSEECVEAAIVRGIAGLRRVLENRRPTPNADSEDMARAIKVENSSILQWLEDQEIGREEFVDGWTTKGAYDAYAAWCHESGIRRPYARPQFGVEICDYFKLKTRATRVNNVPVRVYEPM